MLNDVNFVSIFKHHDQVMELKASWLRKEKLCIVQARSNVSQSTAISYRPKKGRLVPSIVPKQIAEL